MKERKEFLRDLMLSHSPSGYEKDSLTVWDNFMQSIGAEKYYSDKIGNSAWKIGNGPTKILLSAHIDEISTRVQYIYDSGILTALDRGLDRKSLIGSEVLILGDLGPVVGVVEKIPPHLETWEKQGEVPEIDEMKINIGCESKEEVLEKGIHPGSIILYQKRAILEFGEHQVCGTGLDDKSGVYVIGLIMEKLVRDFKDAGSGFPCFSDKYTVIACACTQEETSLRGATIAAREINADISIDFDVTFSTDGEQKLDKEKLGDVVLGKGGVIRYGPDKSLRLAKNLKGKG